jgi:outer membrane protein
MIRFHYQRNVILFLSFLTSPIISHAVIPGGDRPTISGSLTVQQAVSIGMKSNLSIQALAAQEKAAQQDTRAARAMTMPQISANTFLSTGNNSNMLATTPGVEPTNTMDIPPNLFGDQNLTLMAPLYTGGKLSNLVKSSSEKAKAASADVNSGKSSVSFMIKEAYYRALLASEIVKVAQSRVKADEELVKNAENMFEAGKGIDASVSRAKAELSDAHQMLTSSRNNEAKAMLDLKSAMGVRLDSDIALTDRLQFLQPEGNLQTSLEQAMQNRPEIQSARAMLSSSRAMVGVSRGSLQPQIYGAVMGDAFAARNAPSGTGYSVGAVISFPLFDAGQRKAELEQAKAGEMKALADEKNVELGVANEVSQAWLDIQTSEQNYLTAQKAVQSAQAAYDVTALRVENQKGIQVELLDAITALTQARSNLAQALYDHMFAAARLQRAIGRE